MTRGLRSTVAVLVAAAVCSACASVGAQSGAQPAATQSGPAQAGSLGLEQELVDVAMSAAQSFFAKMPAQGQAEKSTAAQAGVTAANDQAKVQGQPLTQTQQQNLFQYIVSKL